MFHVWSYSINTEPCTVSTKYFLFNLMLSKYTRLIMHHPSFKSQFPTCFEHCITFQGNMYLTQIWSIQKVITFQNYKHCFMHFLKYYNKSKPCHNMHTEDKPPASHYIQLQQCLVMTKPQHRTNQNKITHKECLPPFLIFILDIPLWCVYYTTVPAAINTSHMQFNSLFTFRETIEVHNKTIE
jgi:hypothetical protein